MERSPCLDLGVEVEGSAAVSVVLMLCRRGTRLGMGGGSQGGGGGARQGGRGGCALVV